MIWHSASADEVLAELNSDKEKGLDSFTAAERLKEYQKNELHDFTKKSFISLFGNELKNYLNIILMIVAAAYFIIASVGRETGRPEAVLIILLVIINALIGAAQKYRSVDRLNSLRTSVTSMSTVIRDGKETSVPSNELVPGDIMVLKAGDYIRADGRLIDAYVLSCDEFPLTGETVPVDKIPDSLFEDITPIPERLNMVYSGCCVQSGRATAVVTETGISTEIGRAESIVKQTKEQITFLKAKLTGIGKIAAAICFAAAFVVFLIGIIVHFSNSEVSFAATVLNQLLIALSLAVAALPESIPAVLAVALALGVQRMLDSGATVVNLPVAETMKDTTVICTDKTGALTTDKMSVVKVFDGKNILDLKTDAVDESAVTILRLALICSNFKEDEHSERHANSMETAIENACIKYTGMNKADMDGIYPKLAELPFDSERRLMTTVSVINGRPYAIVKGAPEVITSRCVRIDEEKLNKISNSFAEDMLKVIGVAMKPLAEIPANPNSEELENGLTFVGIMGIEDPLRSDTITCFRECDQNGIRVVMITGDHIDTAKAVARRIGILKDGTEAVSSEQLAALDDAQLIENIEKYSVFARVSPEDKLRIVRALQHRFEKVVITGDSINDAPALMEADTGCALGLTGSDMVKGAADVIIHDNKFSTITSAIKESHRIFENVKKSVSYLLSCNTAEIVTVLLGLLLFKDSPLSAAALLWINFISDSFPALALSAERTKEALNMKHSKDSQQIFTIPSLVTMFIQVAVIAAITLGAYAHGLRTDSVTAATLAFAVLAVTEIIHAFGISLSGSAFSKATLKRTAMPIACGISLLILLILLLTPAGALLSLGKLTANGWLFILLSAVIVFVTDEIIKLADILVKKKYN